MDTTQKRRMHRCAQLMNQEENRALGIPRKRGRQTGSTKKVHPTYEEEKAGKGGGRES